MHSVVHALRHNNNVRANMKTLLLAEFLGALLVFSVPHASLATDQNFDELRQKLSSTNSGNRVAAITEMLEMGEKRPLSKDEVALLIPHLKSDSDWSIKCRVTLVLPYAANPDWVLPSLISALQDRDEDSSGGGNVPSYACGALVRLGDSRGLQPIEDWLHYLDSHPKVYGDLHYKLVKHTKERIAELKSKLKKVGSNQTVQQTEASFSAQETNRTPSTTGSHR